MTGSPGFEPTFLCRSLLPPINEHGSGQETEDRHVTKARAAGAGVLGAPSGGAPSAVGQSGGAPPRSRPVPRTPGRSCTAARGSSGPLSRPSPPFRLQASSALPGDLARPQAGVTGRTFPRASCRPGTRGGVREATRARDRSRSPARPSAFCPHFQNSEVLVVIFLSRPFF